MRIKLSWKDIQALVLNGLLTDIGIDLSGDTTSIRAVTNSGECEIEILVGENGNTKPEISLNGNSKMEQILRELRVAAAEIEARIYVLKKTRDGPSIKRVSLSIRPEKM